MVSATGRRLESRLAIAEGLDTRDAGIVVNERMHTLVLNVFAACDVALVYKRQSGTMDTVRALGATPDSRGGSAIVTVAADRPGTRRW